MAKQVDGNISGGNIHQNIGFQEIVVERLAIGIERQVVLDTALYVGVERFGQKLASADFEVGE